MRINQHHPTPGSTYLRLAKASVAVGLLALLAACGPKYSTRKIYHQRIPEGSPVALSVYSTDNAGGCTSLSPLEAYMTAALMGRGFKVYTMKLELYAGRDILNRILCPNCYAKSGGGKGGLFGKLGGGSEGTKPPHDAADVAKAPARFDALMQLLTKMSEQLRVKYHVVIHQFHTFGFAAYVIDRSQGRVLNAFVFSGNSKGFDAVLDDPRKGDYMDAKNGDVTMIHLMRFAEFIVRKI